jgi:hypothetical protein
MLYPLHPHYLRYPIQKASKTFTQSEELRAPLAFRRVMMRFRLDDELFYTVIKH